MRQPRLVDGIATVAAGRPWQLTAADLEHEAIVFQSLIIQ
jgi:hypothetical protein